jgi:hypothetical protein
MHELASNHHSNPQKPINDYKNDGQMIQLESPLTNPVPIAINLLLIRTKFSLEPGRSASSFHPTLSMELVMVSVNCVDPNWAACGN